MASAASSARPCGGSVRLRLRLPLCLCLCLCLWLRVGGGAAVEPPGGDCALLRDDLRGLRTQMEALQRRRAEDLHVLENALHERLGLRQLRDDMAALRVEAAAAAAAARTAGGAQRNEAAALRWAAGAVRELRAEAAAEAEARNASAAAAARAAREAAAQLRLLHSDGDALRRENAELRAGQAALQAEVRALRVEVAQAQKSASGAVERSARVAGELQAATDEWAAQRRAHSKALKELAHSIARRLQLAQIQEQIHKERASPSTTGPSAMVDLTTEDNQVPGHAVETAPVACGEAGGRQERHGRSVERALEALRAGALRLLEGQQALQAQVDGALPQLQALSARLMHDEQRMQEASDDEAGGPEVGLQRQMQQLRQLAAVHQHYLRVVQQLPHDCGGGGGGGTRVLAPGGAPLLAECDQKTEGGGWTLVQRRRDGATDFNRPWVEYARGFGSPQGELWLGLEPLHALTAGGCTELRVEMADVYGARWVARYATFAVASASDGFRLRASGFSGNASDALAYQDGMRFSTVDVDNDSSSTHCAANYEGGWWFSHCQHANLNGRYALGLTWFDASRNEWIAVAQSQMKVRRRRDCSLTATAGVAASAAAGA